MRRAVPPSAARAPCTLAAVYIAFLGVCAAVLQGIEQNQLQLLLQLTQPGAYWMHQIVSSCSQRIPRSSRSLCAGLEALQSADACSEEGRQELQFRGVSIDCTKADTTSGMQSLFAINLDGPKHDGAFVSDPPSTIELPKLDRLRVRGTLLTGGLPACLLTPALKSLTFQNNTKMEATLPTSWGQGSPNCTSLPELRSLQLYSGKWTGTLPWEWGGNSSFPKLDSLTIIGPSIYQEGKSGLTGSIPQSWLLPGSFRLLRARSQDCCTHVLRAGTSVSAADCVWFVCYTFCFHIDVLIMLQELDLRNNSLSGRLPDAVMGIMAAGSSSSERPLPLLSILNVFQQWGSRLCAHIRSDSIILIDHPRLDVGNPRSDSQVDILDYVWEPQNLDASSPSCDDGDASQQMLQDVHTQLISSPEWATGGPDTILSNPPVVVHQHTSAMQPRAEVFIGRCDLPEMLALACVLAGT
jgi:hypothetical protein